MIKKLSLVAFLAALSINAMADMKTIELAYEVELNNFRAPGNQSGTLGMRECDNCESKTLRVNTKTRYTVNEREVSLSDFRTLLRKSDNREDALVIVSHDLESKIVTAVMVTL